MDYAKAVESIMSEVIRYEADKNKPWLPEMVCREERDALKAQVIDLQEQLAMANDRIEFLLQREKALLEKLTPRRSEILEEVLKEIE